MARIPNKCPNCGAELSYNPEENGLTCSHCDTVIPMPDNGEYDTIKPFTEETQLEELKSYMTQYTCASCGRTHSALSTKRSTKCPFCGSSDITQQYVLRFQPDAVLPARISENHINNDFKLWVKKRKFTPNDFKKQTKISKLHLSYYPAWNFFTDLTMYYSGVGVEYRYDDDGNRIRYTRPFSGRINESYTDYFQYANNKSRSLQKVGYFDMTNGVPYSPEYFYGCDVKSTDRDLQESWDIAKSRIVSQQISSVQASYCFDSIEQFIHSETFSNNHYYLTYLPLYELNYSYKGKLYTCYANAITGYIAGKCPKSPWKITFFTLGIIAVIVLIVFLISYFV